MPDKRKLATAWSAGKHTVKLQTNNPQVRRPMSRCAEPVTHDETIDMVCVRVSVCGALTMNLQAQSHRVAVPGEHNTRNSRL